VDEVFGKLKVDALSGIIHDNLFDSVTTKQFHALRRFNLGGLEEPPHGPCKRKDDDDGQNNSDPVVLTLLLRLRIVLMVRMLHAKTLSECSSLNCLIVDVGGQSPNKGQVAVLFGVIQTVTDYELIRNIKSDILYVNLYLRGFGLAK